MSLYSKIFAKKRIQELPTKEKTELTNRCETFGLFQQAKECYFKRQRVQEALVYFNRAFENGFINYFPGEAANFYEFRGICLQELDYDLDAINDFDKAIILSPNDCNKYFLREVSKNKILDIEGAMTDLEKAIELFKIDHALHKKYNGHAQPIEK
jgi:tetratricopeptide (TPR) repeat protein